MILREATPAEKVERDRHAFAEWGERLTLEQFLVREGRLRAHPFARARMRTWLFEDDGRVLASSETFAMDAARGDERLGFLQAIASVVTEPALRGRGHASRMMGALVDRLRAEPGNLGAILYSDVGLSFYERAGFVGRDARDRVLPAERRDHDATLVSDLASLLPIASPVDAITIQPSRDHVDWHLERERSYAALIASPRVTHPGAIVPGGRIAWAVNAKHDELFVLFVEAGDPTALTTLLSAARDVAARLRLARVRVWETPELTRLLPAETEERDGSVPMIALFRDDLAAAEWRSIPRVTWV